MKKIVCITLLALTNGCGMEQVDEGYRGIKTRFGSIQGQPLAPGLHFYNPITSDIYEVSVLETKLEAQESCFTADTQTVIVQYALTYYPLQSSIGDIHSQFGRDWSEKIISPLVRSSIKDAIGKYKADDLVLKRESASAAAFLNIKTELEKRKVVATRLDITNLDFNDEYEHAVEAKVVATQRSIEAENKTKQVAEESKQVVLMAKAEAESMRIRSQSLTTNKNLIMYEAVQNWDGQFPKVILGSGSIPILDMKELTGSEK